MDEMDPSGYIVTKYNQTKESREEMFRTELDYALSLEDKNFYSNKK